MTKLIEAIERAIAAHDGQQEKFAAAVGVSQQAVSSWLGGVVPHERTTAKVLQRALGVSDTDMDAMLREARLARSSQKLAGAAREAPREDVRYTDAPLRGRKLMPILGRAVGGEDGAFEFNGTEIDHIPTPARLDTVNGAYGVYVYGDSMFPRFKSGETAEVNPVKPPRSGDGVVIQIRPAEEGQPPLGFIKEFVRMTGKKLIVRQFNPAKELEYDLGDVISIHKVVGLGLD